MACVFAGLIERQGRSQREVVVVSETGTGAGWIDQAVNDDYVQHLCPIVPLQGLNLTFIVEEAHPTMPICFSDIGMDLGRWEIAVHYISENVVASNATALTGGEPSDFTCLNSTDFSVPYQVNAAVEEAEEEEVTTPLKQSAAAAA